ncbi:MAG: glycosyltransferase family 2 protein [Melioribacteraceae bacterium]|nr:glycosyltransferase family 2 protein [Melioribacteraceae bacterium]MCF8353310.1 glycosyltransferase family 2 protein [Melioribacteraceae bacterium]MCF8393174.1 glycosyltransferase family 2 protein [Melioribacteraceae bacterium]MCF8419035.1 glycosyltransferase family 2 protein [Melioribacteraceae bacterium]
MIIVTTVVISNMYTAPKLYNREYDLERQPLISVLIPARNEENHISKALNSLLTQTYKNIEIIILDDGSTDSTVIVTEWFTKRYENVRLIKGLDLPAHWLGKNWACHQLSKEANGELLLFMDADVQLSNFAIASAVNTYQKRNVSMLSCFPTQIIDNFGAWLVIPLMNWMLLTFLPLNKVYTSPKKSYVAASGQFILIDKEIYNKVGGHEAVQDKVVEDMELARLMKRRAKKIITVLGNDAIYCEMYSGFANSVIGFSKNFFPGFKVSPFQFSLILFFILLFFFVPIFLSIINFLFLWIVLTIAFNRMVVAIISRQNLFYNVLLHPLQMIAVLVTGIYSMYVNLKRKTEWKGRKIQ